MNDALQPPSQPPTDAPPEWEREIRASEEIMRIAFLNGDVATLDRIWSPVFAVNSPLQKVLPRSLVLTLLQSGRIRHTSFESVIETMSREGDTVVVMGNDRVIDPPDGTVSHRRFTNVWRHEAGQWRAIARHAHVLGRDASA
ncbi:MAG TPA: nuclear transport factor 2 family protein [Opitutaceae bacterium]|nr:nuclear transport factor 2 family protein [Opitutaceae bacterium]